MFRIAVGCKNVRIPLEGSPQFGCIGLGGLFVMGNHVAYLTPPVLIGLLELLGKPLAVRVVNVEDRGRLAEGHSEFPCDDALKGIRWTRPEEIVLTLVSGENRDQRGSGSR